MTQSLPDKPDLRRLRDLARALQRDVNAGEREALARVQAHLPSLDPTSLKLAAAQTVIARENSFATWSNLKAEVEARQLRAMLPLTDARMLAQRWFGLADAGDVMALNRSLAVGKGRLEAAREAMRAQSGPYRRFLDVMVAGLRDRRPRARFECAHALDVFGDITCREPLIALMEDRVPKVRWMAMHALSCHACGEGLGEVDDAVVRRIADAALTDDSIQVRRQASAALGLGGWSGAAPVLRQILNEATDGKLLRTAVWALKTLERSKAA